MGSLPTGILRLKAADRYIVAELNVTGNHSMPAELCVFNSGTGKWKIIRKPQLLDQSNGGHFFDLRSTHHVLAFDSRFLCWVDYFSGVLLCDFSTIDSPRSASCHSLERMTTITSPDDPDVLCCLLREEEFRGKAWMNMVDMNHAYLRSCTPYCIKCADAECGGCVNDRYRFPPYVELLPTVFSTYLESPTTSKERKKKRKRKANRSIFIFTLGLQISGDSLGVFMWFQ
uniref:DUF1618 domain-containing protein n=1 Tax=Aegilops tauschii TaxID=37682 RepID=R7WEJ6_AEGTA